MTKLFESVRSVQRGFSSGANDILLPSDYAVRADRQFQRQMRRDPHIEGPLRQRMYAVSLMDWSIVPEDEDDEKQVDQAAELTHIVEHHLRKQRNFLLSLSNAVWYGPAAVNVIYDRVDGIYAPVDWIPLHSDSITFDIDGRPGIRVNPVKVSGAIPGPDSMVKILDGADRRAVILHTANIEAPDFDEPREAAYLYAGRGLRDVIWFWFRNKQEVMQSWMTGLERYAQGLRVARYPTSNDQAKRDAIEILENWITDNAVALPSEQDGQGNYLWSIDVMEMGAAGIESLQQAVDRFRQDVKELILGQTATTEAVSTGLGSSVGDQHAETFHRIIRYDAEALEDTLTHEFVRELQLLNYGQQPHRFRWKFAIDKTDPHDLLENVSQFVALGGSVREDDVRDALGLERPNPGDDVLEPSQGFQDDDPVDMRALRFAKSRNRRNVLNRVLES